MALAGISWLPSLHRRAARVIARVSPGVRSTAIAATSSIIVAAGLLAFAAPLYAAPGDLDPSFSGDGILLTGFGGEADGGAAVALQADGKIVIAGTTAGYGEGGDYQSDFALARLEADGTLDPSFSGDGKQITHFGTAAGAAAVAVQPDRKIVVAGSARVSSLQSDFALARYRPDGSLDSSFGGDGTVTSGPGGFASSVAIQSDGRIVVGGDSGLARYWPDGSLDGSFGGDGTVTTGPAAYSVAIQSDGRIVVGGASQLARYLPDGSLDTTFSNDGTVPTGAVWARSVAIQADDRIVVAGGIVIAEDLPHYDFALLRYTPDGALDTSFGSAGMQTTRFDAGWWEDEIAAAVALQADGKIVAVGTSTPVDWVWEGSAIVLARYATDGSLDQSFGDGGKRFTFHGVDNSGETIAIQHDGKIVVGGSGSDPGDGSGRALVARYEGGSTSEGTAPANSAPPAISGNAVVGQTLTVSPGVWSGTSPIAVTYRWRRCDSAAGNCADIAAATATTYVATAADVGHTIRVRETATNAYGTGAVDSAATGVVNTNVGGIEGSVSAAKTGAPIASGSVNCGSGYSDTTDNNGNYSIANLLAGSYACTASAKHYTPSTQTVSVAAGRPTIVRFTLARR